MSTKDQLELARWAADQAVKAGAKEARATVTKTRNSSLEYRERKVETLEESTVNGLSVNLYIDGKYSAHRTSDLRKDALKTFLKDAVAMTKYLTADKYRYLPEPEYYEGRKQIDLEMADPDYSKVQPEDRHRMVKTIEGAALEMGGEKIISVTAGYSESMTDRAMVATNGFEGVDSRTSYWCGAEVTAKDKGDKRPEDSWWEGQRHRADLSNANEIGRKATLRALQNVGSDKILTEELPMVVENRAAGRLVGFYDRAFYGYMLQQKRSFLEGKVGEKIAAEHFSVIDDPFITRGLASRLFDNEGITAKKMAMIENGVLKNYYIDTYYGRKLEMRATAGSSSNTTFVSKNTKSVEAWMKELGRGILVTGFLGGNSNPATGDFSTGVKGFLFENGEIKEPVSAMNIAGNHLEFWHKLMGLGDDPYKFSSARTPSLVFEPTTIAGA